MQYIRVDEQVLLKAQQRQDQNSCFRTSNSNEEHSYTWHFCWRGMRAFRWLCEDLGIWLDENLTFKHQIKKVVSSCFLILKELSRIKYFIPKEHLSSLVASLIFSKLDYCNALYYNIAGDEMKYLQSVQNAAVRLVYGGSKFDRQHISHRFTELHWLKIKE